ncbi:hypothetical protein [Stratiformator vulcanicus]|uniref:Uncharacterized protein n=1 Tax=Stratiformator vulcanicus TaxID=2527980 RepID=A0A517R376_9PLAN|nr:hypothetical protein [Stratiformator vulcanicus]QDT38336.1 hypothetical protein Pan189_27270 [Stratiformator vulcanicus]
MPFDSRAIRFWLYALVLPTLVFVSGCGGSAEIEFVETKRLDEGLTNTDIKILQAVFGGLTDEERAALPEILAPRADWSADRTLPVKELYEEELTELVAVHSLERLAEAFPKSPSFERQVERTHRTREQVAALYASAGYALSRKYWGAVKPLDRLMQRAEDEMWELRNDERPFASLSPEARYRVLERAGWISVADRVEQLMVVAEQNVETVTEFEDELRKVLPGRFFADPLSPILPRLAVYGVPFEEDDPDRSDADLTWNSSDVVTNAQSASLNSNAATEVPASEKNSDDAEIEASSSAPIATNRENGRR